MGGGKYNNFQYKAGVNPADLGELHPAMYILIGEAALYATLFGLPLVFTSIMDTVPGRISKTHEDGRGVDLSVRGWGDLHPYRFAKYLNDKYAEELGTAPAGKPLKVIPDIDHGTARHLHLQVRVNANLEGMFPT